MALLRFIYVFICVFFLVQPDCEAAHASKKQLHFSQAGIFSLADDSRIVTQHNAVKQELARRDLSVKYSDGRERQYGSPGYSSSFQGCVSICLPFQPQQLPGTLAHRLAADLPQALLLVISRK